MRPVEETLIRCRVCRGMTPISQCHCYRYTSRYVGDNGYSRPKVFSLCRVCLQEGVDALDILKEHVDKVKENRHDG